MHPKIADFGLAKLFIMDQTPGTTRIVGTPGYMAPECHRGNFSVRSDVYSFGLLLLELVSGQKKSCFCVGGIQEDLISFARDSLREGCAANMIDPIIINGSRNEEIVECIKIGLLCVQERVNARPTMHSVVQMLRPMVYGCLYCARSYQDTLATLHFADSKTLKEEKREELFENLKAEEAIGWAVDIIDPRELSAKMLKKEKINFNEISHCSAMGLVSTVLNRGVLLTEVYVDTVGDPEKYRIRLSEKFPDIKFVVAKKADSLYPVVSGASIVAKVTRDRALKDWVMDETCESMHRSFGSGYPGDPGTKAWLEDHRHALFGFPTLVRFSWGTCTPFFKKSIEILW
ncbi:unnamed protein product [Rhodiola kirilowii]